MVEKSDIEELEKIYKKTVIVPEVKQEPVYSKPTVEVQTPQDKVFVPVEPLNRNIDHIIEVMAEKRKQEWIEASYKKLEQLLYQDGPSQTQQPQLSYSPPKPTIVPSIEDVTPPQKVEPKKSGDVSWKVGVAALVASVGIGGLIWLTIILSGVKF